MPKSVYDKFRARFAAGQAAAPSLDHEMSEAQRVAAAAEGEDRRVFSGTNAFTQYREMLVNEIDGCIPDSKYGSEAAAATAYTQKGLRVALGYLDTMALAEDD